MITRRYTSLLYTDECEGSSLIVTAPCREEDVSKHGIVDLDQTDKVVLFLEKPLHTETSSRKQSPCFYLLSRQAVGKIKEYLYINKNDTKKSDSTGSFIRYLVDQLPVYAYQVPLRFDLGNLGSCIEANKYFENFENV